MNIYLRIVVYKVEFGFFEYFFCFFEMSIGVCYDFLSCKELIRIVGKFNIEFVFRLMVKVIKLLFLVIYEGWYK